MFFVFWLHWHQLRSMRTPFSLIFEELCSGLIRKLSMEFVLLIKELTMFCQNNALMKTSNFTTGNKTTQFSRIFSHLTYLRMLLISTSIYSILLTPQKVNLLYVDVQWWSKTLNLGTLGMLQTQKFTKDLKQSLYRPLKHFWIILDKWLYLRLDKYLWHWLLTFTTWGTCLEKWQSLSLNLN